MKIDIDDCQILIADLQAGLGAASATHLPDQIERAATALVRFASSVDIPVTFSLVGGAENETLTVKGLRPFVSGENFFARVSASPFLDPRVVAALQAKARSTLIVMGFAAEVVVLHSALDASEIGFKVIVPVDAIGGLSVRTEQVALAQITAAGARLTSVPSLLSMLAPDFSRAPGDAALACLLKLQNEQLNGDEAIGSPSGLALS